MDVFFEFLRARALKLTQFKWKDNFLANDLMGTYPPGNYPFPKIALEDDFCLSKGGICDHSLEGST